MAWFKIDDNFITSRKVLKIPRRLRPEAIGIWTLTGVWSAHERTDGVVPWHILEEFGCTEELREELVMSGLWLVGESEGDRLGIVFHDWCEYQPTREQLEDKAKNRAVKASNAAKTRWNNAPPMLDECSVDAKAMLKDAPEPEPEPEPLKKNLSKNEILFDSFWDIYPKRSGKGKARESWLKAVKKEPAQKILDAAKAYSTSKDLPEYQFVPMPATWLNQERWNDDLAPAPKDSKNLAYDQASLYCKKHGFPIDDCYKCDPEYVDV